MTTESKKRSLISDVKDAIARISTGGLAVTVEYCVVPGTKRVSVDVAGMATNGISRWPQHVGFWVSRRKDITAKVAELEASIAKYRMS